MRRVEGASDGGKGSESRKEVLRNELLRLQNNEIEVRRKTGVPRRSYSNTQVNNSSFFYGEESLPTLCKLRFKIEECLILWSVSVNERMMRIEPGHLYIYNTSAVTWRIFYSY